MNIAVFHNLPSGGAKRSLFEEVRGLSSRHHLDVFTLSSANHDFSDLRPCVRRHAVWKFDPAPLFRSPFGRLNSALRTIDLLRLRALAQKMARVIDRGGYDVVLVEPCQFENSPSLLRYLRNTPAVYYCHEPLRRLYEEMPSRPYEGRASRRASLLDSIDPLAGLYRFLSRRQDRTNLRRARRVVVNSEFTRRQVKSIYETDAGVSYHGVDAERFRPVDGSRKDYVLSVGSLTPLKGFDFLIQSLGTIEPRLRPRLLIASNFENPPERAYLLTLAEQCNVDLDLLGRVSDEKLAELYAHAILTAYAPVREPFGLVPLESMACATPVVGVEEGGIPESVIHDRTGLLAERDARAFGGAIAALLEAPERRDALGANGRRNVVERWTWSQAVQSLAGHLTQAARETIGEPQSATRSMGPRPAPHR